MIGTEVRTRLAGRVRWEHVSAYEVLQDPFRWAAHACAACTRLSLLACCAGEPRWDRPGQLGLQLRVPWPGTTAPVDLSLAHPACQPRVLRAAAWTTAP